MQVIVNISDEGNVSTEVRRGPSTIGAVTTSESTEAGSKALDAGAGPFETTEGSETVENRLLDASDVFDGGAGPTS